MPGSDAAASGVGYHRRVRKLTFTVPLPDRFYAALRSLARRARRQGPGHDLDLSGDRDVEWSWVAGSIPQGPGEALDFGPGVSYLGLIAARRGFSVTAVDLELPDPPYRHRGLRFRQGDILDLPLEDEAFDLILNCSTVEHVGIPGRYGVTTGRADGDLTAMSRLRASMKPDGVMLLTIPVGRDAVFPPLHRVYGPTRLPRLLEGFGVMSREYWTKGEDNRWHVVDEDAALDAVPDERSYGLGCFVLARQ